jgi:ketosteroid isomerase-like protein
MSHANVTLVQNLYAAFQRGDVESIIAALEPDIAGHSHGRPEDYPTLGLREGAARGREVFPDHRRNRDRDRLLPT